MQTKMLLTVAASVLALTSSTRCFAESVASAKPVATKAVAKKSLKVKIDLSSPERTVRTFVAAINAQDIDALIACAHGIKLPAGKQGAEVRSRLASRIGMALPDASPVTSFMRVSDFQVDIQSSPVRVECVVQIVLPSLNRRIRSSVLTKRDQDGWKILPTTQAEMEKMNEEQMQANEGDDGVFVLTIDPLLSTVTEIVQALPEVMRDTERETQDAADMTGQANLRQLASAAMQFVQEYDEKMAFDASNFRERIKTYVRGEKTFLNPKTGQPFAMNPALANIEISKIAAPSQTVLFYTGANGVLSFDNFDKAAVAFVDGHVQIISRAEAAKLRWNP